LHSRTRPSPCGAFPNRPPSTWARQGLLSNSSSANRAGLFKKDDRTSPENASNHPRLPPSHRRARLPPEGTPPLGASSSGKPPKGRTQFTYQILVGQGDTHGQNHRTYNISTRTSGLVRPERIIENEGSKNSSNPLIGFAGWTDLRRRRIPEAAPHHHRNPALRRKGLRLPRFTARFGSLQPSPKTGTGTSPILLNATHMARRPPFGGLRRYREFTQPIAGPLQARSPVESFSSRPRLA
jgi:hypothetical protein